MTRPRFPGGADSRARLKPGQPAPSRSRTFSRASEPFLICFKNGSLAREKVRDRLGAGWPGFNRALESAPPGNRGRVMLPWFDPEITPAVLHPEVRLYG